MKRTALPLAQMRGAARPWVILLTLLLIPGSAFAGPPERLTHQGRLTDKDGPVDAQVEMTFSIFASEEGGSALWSEEHDVEVEDGWYTVLLGGETAGLAALFVDQEALWLEQVIDGGAPLTPRQRMSAVPYALAADTATNVIGGLVDVDEVQVGGETVIDAAGNWMGGAGSVGWGALGGMSCGSGERPSWTGTMWDCGPVQWAELEGVPADLADGDDDAMGGLSCADGEDARWLAGAWACGAPDVDPASITGDTAQVGQVLSWGASGAEWADMAATGGCAITDLSPSLARLDCGASSVRVRKEPDFVGLARDASNYPVLTDAAGNLWGSHVYNDWPPQGPYVSVAGGGYGGCGLRADGSLGCWGVPGTPPAGSFAYVAVSSSGERACAIATTAGSLSCWGLGAWVSSHPTGPFSHVAISERTGCVLRLSGSIECWRDPTLLGSLVNPGGTYTDLFSVAGDEYCATNVSGPSVCFNPNATHLRPDRRGLRSLSRVVAHLHLDGPGIARAFAAGG